MQNLGIGGGVLHRCGPARSSRGRRVALLLSLFAPACIGVTAASANPVAWYRFNAPNYGFDAARGNQGLLGAATVVPGVQVGVGPIHGTALRFKPTNNVHEFSIPHSEVLDIVTPDMAGMAWIRPLGTHTSDNSPGDCNQGTICSKGGNYWFQIKQNNTAIEYQHEGSGAQLVSVNVPGAIPLSTWSHVAFVRSANATETGYTIKIYFNGAYLGEADVTTAPSPNTAPVSVGNYGFNGPGDCEFNGDIDELKIFDRALTSAEIAAEYQLVAQPDTRVRKSYTASTAAELQDYVDACLALKLVDPGATDADLLGYDDFVKIHKDFMSGAHGGPSFLAWHRMFLLMFEDALRGVNSGEFASVTIPYWDWSVDPFPTTVVGGNGDSQGIVTTGPFAFSTGDWTININGCGGNKLRRSFSDNLLLPTPFTPYEVEQALALPIFDSAPWNFGSSTSVSFRNNLEYTLHNTIHGCIGGCMGNVTSACNDPVFWMHHANVDRIWCQWQTRYETELHHIPCTGAPAGHNAYDVMQPFAVTPADATNMSALGVEYDDCVGPCVDKGQFWTGLTYSQAMLSLACNNQMLCPNIECAFEVRSVGLTGCNFGRCPDGTSPGICGCDHAAEDAIDTDGDTVPDCIDRCPFLDDRHLLHQHDSFRPVACSEIQDRRPRPRPPVQVTALPNPSNAAPSLMFELADPSRVQVTVHDLRGRLVCRVLDTELTRGIQRVRWDGRDNAGNAVQSGVYLARVHTGDGIGTTKLVLVK